MSLALLSETPPSPLLDLPSPPPHPQLRDIAVPQGMDVPSLLPNLHLWWVHFIFTFKYHLYANGCQIQFSSSFVFLSPQTHILSVYLITPIWMPSKHLKLNMSQTQLHNPHPTSPSSFQLMATSSQKLTCHPWLLPFLMSYIQASSVSKVVRSSVSKYVKSLITFTLTITTLVIATIISGLNYCNNLLMCLPGSSSHCNLFSK